MRAHERARESQRERECGGERELFTEWGHLEPNSCTWDI